MSSGLKMEERQESEIVAALRRRIERTTNSTQMQQLISELAHALVERQLSAQEAVRLSGVAEKRASTNNVFSSTWATIAEFLGSAAPVLEHAQDFDDCCKEVKASPIFTSIVTLLSARPQKAELLEQNVFHLLESSALTRKARSMKERHLTRLEEIGVVEPVLPSRPQPSRQLTGLGHRIAFVLGLERSSGE